METEKKKRNNKKIYIPIFIFVLGTLLSWGTWVSDGIYTSKGNMIEVKKNIDKLQKGQEDIRKEMKVDRELAIKSQEKIYEILIHIKESTDEK